MEVKMDTLKSLINKTDFSDVWNCITRHYGIKKNSYNKFKNLYDKLLKITFDENVKNMIIYICI
jgi:hypothetical protein